MRLSVTFMVEFQGKDVVGEGMGERWVLSFTDGGCRVFIGKTRV